MTPEILRRLDTLEVRRIKQQGLSPASQVRLNMILAHIAAHGEQATVERWPQVARILELLRTAQARKDRAQT